MANHKSAAKRAKQTIVKTARNLSIKKTVRTTEKKLKLSLGNKNKDECLKLLQTFTSTLGKAAQKGVYKKETVSRKISRLSKQVSAL